MREAKRKQDAAEEQIKRMKDQVGEGGENQNFMYYCPFCYEITR